MHEIKGLPHADGMLLAYLPKEKIIAYADMYNVPAPTAPAAPPTAGFVVMADNLERLKIDFDTVISVHAPNPDRPVKRADFLRISATAARTRSGQAAGLAGPQPPGGDQLENRLRVRQTSGTARIL